MKLTRRILITGLLAGLLSSCGRNGPLEPPPGYDPKKARDEPSILDKLI